MKALSARLLALYTAALVALAPGAAWAHSTVTFLNTSPSTLHVYFTYLKDSFDCRDVRYAISLPPGGTWDLTVPSGVQAKVVADPKLVDGCVRAPRFDVLVSGDDPGRSHYTLR